MRREGYAWFIFFFQDILRSVKIKIEQKSNFPLSEQIIPKNWYENSLRKSRDKSLEISSKGIGSYNILMLLNSGKFETLIARLIVDRKFEKAIAAGMQKYQIRQFKVHYLTPNQVFSMYNVLTTKFYFNKITSDLDAWYQNELRLFVWLVIGYSFLESRCISEMTIQDWRYFSEIFNNRNPEQLEFQALSVLKKQNKFSKWTAQQINLLHSIIKSKNIKNKWNQIARELFIKSAKQHFRSAKQCRQYWINHLDPTPLKGEWTTEEDLELILTIKELGKKWAKVSKCLGGRRTQHMVKNRFRSLYHFQSKKCSQEFHRIRSQNQIINEMQMKLRKKINEKSLQFCQVSTEQTKVTLIEEKEIKIQSAEGEITEQIPTSPKNEQECQFMNFEEQIESQDNQYEKLPMISQTFESILDEDERDIRLDQRVQKFLSVQFNTFCEESAFI